MTIYKPNGQAAKQERMLGTGPEVVIDDKIPLTKKDIEAAGGDVLLIRRTVTNTEVVRRRRALKCAMVVVAIVLVIIIAAASAMLVFRHLNRPNVAFCNLVQFHEDEVVNGVKVPHRGTFEERVEVDNANGIYERLDVPPILDSRGSTVVHDFEKNLTAIVDKDHARCFVFPLNRAVVQPPVNFYDLIQKFKSGYYLPDAEVVRETYKVVTPAVDNIEPFGYYIWYDCQYFDTYRLVKDTEPIVASKKKRSTTECLSFDSKFSLGGLGERLTIVTLAGCSD